MRIIIVAITPFKSSNSLVVERLGYLPLRNVTLTQPSWSIWILSPQWRYICLLLLTTSTYHYYLLLLWMTIIKCCHVYLISIVLSSPQNLYMTGQDTFLCGQPCVQIAGLLSGLRILGFTQVFIYIHAYIYIYIYIHAYISDGDKVI